MESKIFKGIGQSELLKIQDDELKNILFSPGYKEFLKIGGVTFFLLFSISFFAGTSDYAADKASAYNFCTSSIYGTLRPGDVTKAKCDEVLAEAASHNLSTKEAYANYKVSQFEADPSNPSNIIRILGGTIFAISAVLAFVKKSNPFFMTKIGAEMEITFDGSTLISAKIGGKTVKKGFLGEGRIMLRKFASQNFVVSFYSPELNFVVSFYSPELGSEEVVPSQERMVMDKKQAMDFGSFLKRFNNVKFESTSDNEILISFK